MRGLYNPKPQRTARELSVEEENAYRDFIEAHRHLVTPHEMARDFGVQLDVAKMWLSTRRIPYRLNARRIREYLEARALREKKKPGENE